MTTPKKLYRLKAFICFASAIVVPLVLIGPSSASKGGLTAAAIVGGTFLAVACYHWYLFKRTPEEAVFYDISKQPPAEQIRVSQRVIWGMVILGPVLSYWTYHDLTSIETGAEESVSLWAPVAMLYDNFGFWPAVLCWPLLCLFAVGAAFFRIEKAKSLIASKDD